MKKGAEGDLGDRKIDLSGVWGTITEVCENPGGGWSADAHLDKLGGWLILDYEVDLVEDPQRKG